jgi:DNA-binding NarL/FixJ family response regulator
MNEKCLIAIVDDNTMFRKGLAALINLFPRHQVLFDAGGGNECMAKLKAGCIPHIILMDIGMPQPDGYKVTAWIKDHYPEIRVLALSTMDSESAIIQMIKSGARGYVLKDSDPEDLKTSFDDVLALGYYYNEVVSRKIIKSVHLLAKDDPSPASVLRLTEREIQFLKLACSEKTYTEIAKEMFVSERTVDGYRDALFKKLTISSRVGLVLYALRNNITRL